MWREKKVQYPAILITATAALFHVKGLFSFLSAQQFAGRDLASNYAFTWLMQQNLMQGKIFSWSNQWLMGFPSFEIYPPFFFTATSSLNIALGSLIDLQTVFKIVVFLSVFLVPLTTYLSTKELFKKEKAFFAGFYSLLFIFVYPPVSQAYQVFSTGLVAQGFAFTLVLAAIGLMLRKETRYKIVSGILLGLSALSHPFVALAGFTVSTSLFLMKRDMSSAAPNTIGGVIFLPWILTALPHLPYVATYTFEPANTGVFLYLLLPLIALGGITFDKAKPLFVAFGVLLSLSIFEIPYLSQELRFYTYSLGIGSILAGLGGHRVYQHLTDNIDINKLYLGLLLLLPVLGLSIQADMPQTWSYEGNFDPLIQEMQSQEKGRLLVETSNASIYDSFVVQAEIPVKTKHWAINDVHLDSSTSANYILTLESWISDKSLYNPICRTCNTSAPSELISQRLDDLGVKYIATRTEHSKNLMKNVAKSRGRHGDYQLFENSENHQIVEKLNYRPIALKGSYKKWKNVNDLLFHSQFKGEVVWLNKRKDYNYAATIDMNKYSTHQILTQIKNTEPEKIRNYKLNYKITDDKIKFSSTGPVKVKADYYPSKNREGVAGTFNSIIFPQKDVNQTIG